MFDIQQSSKNVSRLLVSQTRNKKGCAGALAQSVIYRLDGTMEVINSKIIQKLQPGDRVVVETAGGGGYGDIKERSQQSVIADQVNRKS